MEDLDLPFVSAKLSFIESSNKWDTEKPYAVSGPLPAHQEPYRCNITYTNVETKFFNLRGHEKALSVEHDGFEINKFPTAVPLSLDLEAEDNTQEYLKESGNWLSQRFNAETVLCYAYRYRTTDYNDDLKEHEHDIGSRLKPDTATGHPHVDQTLEGGLRRAQRHMSEEEAKKYLDSNKWRIRIFNVWRPIGYPVEDAPLAFCDYKTVDHSDLVAADRVSEQYAGETYYLKQNPRQRWYWFATQTPEEAIVFLSYDTHPGQGPKFCAHSSFMDTGAGPDARFRQSVEVRAIVVTQVESD